jgi:hypothetical protein
MRRAAILVLLVGAVAFVATSAATATHAPTAVAKRKPKPKHHQPAPPEFTVVADSAGWHHIGPGDSDACALFRTTPPQRNAKATISFGPKNNPTTTVPVRLGPDGTYFATFPISAYGLYAFTLTVTVQGVSETASIDDDVAPDPTLKPPCK